jgi:hypothetical protein
MYIDDYMDFIERIIKSGASNFDKELMKEPMDNDLKERLEEIFNLYGIQ